jgi:uncharacterized OB-fold protein
LTTTQRKHVVEGAFAETANGPRLLGSRCAGCSACFFPRSPACRNPKCADKRIEDVELSPRGTLWTYTVQYYKPPPPARFDDPFTPYGVGLVDLPEGIRIMGMISSDDPDSLKIGQEMELVIETLYHDDDGSEVLTWKWRPV